MNGASSEDALANISACKLHSVTRALSSTCACTNHAHAPGSLFLQAFHVISDVLTRACQLADKRAMHAMQLVLQLVTY